MGTASNARRFGLICLALASGLLAATAIAQEQRWGALSVASDAYGWATGQASRQEAENAALENCRKHSKKKDCETRAMPQGSCGTVISWSVAKGARKGSGNIMRFADTEADAQARGLADCEKNYGGCRQVYAFCNG